MFRGLTVSTALGGGFPCCAMMLNVPKSRVASKAVDGTFQVQAYPCGITLCAEGIATGDLAGDVFVEITSSKPIVDPITGIEVGSNDTAFISIDTPDGFFEGTIVGRSVFKRINEQGQPISSIESTVTLNSGTGKWAKRTASLDVQGEINLVTFEEFDFYSGTTQVNP